MNDVLLICIQLKSLEPFNFVDVRNRIVRNKTDHLIVCIYKMGLQIIYI